MSIDQTICSHDELKWGRKREIIGGQEIVVCGGCREEMPAVLTRPKSAHAHLDEDGICRGCGEDRRTGH